MIAPYIYKGKVYYEESGEEVIYGITFAETLIEAMKNITIDYGEKHIINIKIYPLEEQTTLSLDKKSFNTIKKGNNF